MQAGTKLTEAQTEFQEMQTAAINAEARDAKQAAAIKVLDNFLMTLDPTATYEANSNEDVRSRELYALAYGGNPTEAPGLSNMITNMTQKYNLTEAQRLDIIAATDVKTAQSTLIGAQEQEIKDKGLTEAQALNLGKLNSLLSGLDPTLAGVDSELRSEIGELYKEAYGVTSAPTLENMVAKMKQEYDITDEQWLTLQDERVAKEFGNNMIELEALMRQSDLTDPNIDPAVVENIRKKYSEAFNIPLSEVPADVQALTGSFFVEKKLFEEGFTQAQKETLLIQSQTNEINTGINKQKYEDALATADFTDSTTVNNLIKLKNDYLGEGSATADSFKSFVDEAWDIKEGQAGEDLSSYITNIKGQWEGRTNWEWIKSDPALVEKVNNYFEAQGNGVGINKQVEAVIAADGRGYTNSDGTPWVPGSDKVPHINGAAVDGWTQSSKLIDQMRKSPTQIDREQALANFKTSLGYRNSDDPEAALELFYELDWLSQTEGIKYVDMPDGSKALIDSEGQIISSENDYTTTGTVNGKRYVTNQDGIVSTSNTDGNQVDYRVEGRVLQYKEPGGSWSSIYSLVDNDTKGIFGLGTSIFEDMGFQSGLNEEGDTIWFEYEGRDEGDGGAVTKEDVITEYTYTGNSNYGFNNETGSIIYAGVPYSNGAIINTSVGRFRVADGVIYTINKDGSTSHDRNDIYKYNETNGGFYSTGFSPRMFNYSVGTTGTSQIDIGAGLL
jgi:hypothetical protein